jgi:hypothetical protein
MRSLKGLLALFSVQALLALLWIFFTPSESGRAVILWLSRERLLLLGIAFLVWAALVAAAIFLQRSRIALGWAQARLDRFCLEHQQLGSLLIFLVVIPLLVLAASLRVAFNPLDYGAYRNWAPVTFPLVHSLAIVVLPLLLLFVLAALEFAAFLSVHYGQSVRDPGIWSWSRIGPPLLMLGTALLTLFYWLVLVFQLRFFVNNPAWYWKFDPVPLNRGDALFVLVSLLLLALAYWILILRRHIVGGLVLVFLLGLFLQFSVGLMSGGGFVSFQDRYFSTYHKTYISKATGSSASLLDTVRQYEQLYGSRSFTNTKPPGLMVFYTALDHMINGYPSLYSDEVRFGRLSGVISYAYPMIAMLMVFGVYAFARRHVPGRLGVVPGLASFLLVLCPNLVLFSLFPDQALYPLLFIFGAVFIISTIQRQSLPLALLLGLFLYMAVFFTFTMLPLYPFAFLYLALTWWLNRRDRRLSRQVWMALLIAVSTLLIYLLFRLFLNYDFLPRFAKTIAINHDFDFYLRIGRQPPASPESFPTRLTQIIAAAWLNNLDFAAALGFPLYILFVVQSVRLLTRLFKANVAPADIILAALLLSFIVLNLVGTAQGEVPRLWLFWLPLVVLLVALEIEALFERHPRVLVWLAFAQLVTIFLTFHFQDLRM